MAIRESTLPGVGKRYGIDLDAETQAIVIVHHSGQRELYVQRGNADSVKLLDLSDEQARMLGSILEGTHFQPVASDRMEAVLSEDALIEWITVPEHSPLDGQTLQEAGIRERTGATVIAVQRDSKTIPNPFPDTRIEAADTLVAIGTDENHQQLAELVQGSA